MESQGYPQVRPNLIGHSFVNPASRTIRRRTVSAFKNGTLAGLKLTVEALPVQLCALPADGRQPADLRQRGRRIEVLRAVGVS